MLRFRLTLWMLAILAIGFSVTACNNDDDDDDGRGNTSSMQSSGTATFQGQTYDLVDGYIDDYGSGSTHYNYDFNLFDMEVEVITVDGETVAIPNLNSGFYIYMELFSNGTAGFQTGTFDYEPGFDYDGKDYFDFIVLLVDNDEDGDLFNNPGITADGGSVTIDRNGDDWTIDFNLELDNGSTLTGNFEGKMPIIDER